MAGAMKGGCLCGAVRYEVSDPIVTVICHCTHCQKISGSAYSLNQLFPEGNVRLQGTTQSYTDTGDSGGRLQRHFCPKCGSSLYSKADALPGMTILKAGTLDDTSGIKPTVQIYCDRAHAWAPLLAGTKNHALAMS